MLKKALLGESQFFGNERFLVFGNELHKRLLKHDEKRRKMEPDEELLLANMLDALESYSPLQRYMKGAKLEKIHVVPIDYSYAEPKMQWVKVILDIEKKKVGVDIKTTSCTTEDAFIKAARKYSYPKQGWMYSEARKLDEFIFVGCSKKPGNKIFEYHLNDYPHDKQQGMEEGIELVEIHNSLKTFYNSQLK